MLTTIGWLIAAILLLAIALSALWAGLRAAPYLPTHQRDVERLLKLAAVQPADLVYDLGAGDGRLVLTATRDFRARAIGYEISFLPYLVAQFRIAVAQLGGRAKIQARDFFRVDLSDADVVVCFLTPPAMMKLRKKFERELRPGTRVASYVFPIAGWTPIRRDKPDERSLAIYLYRVPANTKSVQDMLS